MAPAIAGAGTALLTILDTLFEVYPTWSLFIPRGIHVVAMIACAVGVTRFPYASVQGNTVAISTAICAGISSCVRLVTMVDDNLIGHDIYFFAVLAVDCLVVVLTGFICANWKARVRRVLAYDGVKNIVEMDEQPSEDAEPMEGEKQERLMSLGLSESEAIAYLYFGLDGCCDLLLDLSLVRFVIAQFPNSANALVHSMRIVVCFPTQTDVMERLLEQTKAMKSLSVSERYLLWQFSRVRIIRQASSTAAAAVKAGQLLQETRELSGAMQQFWQTPNTAIWHLRWMASKRRQLEAQWRELLEEFPNSAAVHDGFCEYQLECCCHFDAAARTKCKIDLLGKKSWRAVDKCFVAFVRTFPAYIKSGVLDHTGALLRHGEGGTQASSKAMKIGEVSVVNFAPEPYLDCGVLRHTRLRVALEIPLAEVRTASHHWLIRLGVGALLLQVTAFIVVFALLYFLFDSALDRLICSQAATSCRLACSRSMLYVMLAFANGTGRFSPTTNFDECYLRDSSDALPFTQLASEQLTSALDQYTLFTTALASVAVDSPGLTETVVTPSIEFPLCVNGEVTNKSSLSLTAIIVGQVSNIGRLLLPNQNWSSAYQDNVSFCMAVSSIRPIADAIHETQTRLFDEYVAMYSAYGSSFQLAAAAVPVGLAIVTYVFAPLLALLYLREMRRLFVIALRCDAAARDEAARPLGAQYIHCAKASLRAAAPGISFVSAYSLLLLVVFLIIAGLSAGALLFGGTTASDVVLLESFAHSNNVRLPRTTEAAVHMYNAWLGQGTNSSSVNVTAEQERVMWLLDAVDAATVDLQSSSGGGSIMGFDDEIDNLVLSGRCTLPENPKELHELYNCSYTTHLFVVFRRLVREIIQLLPNSRAEINDVPLTNLQHIVLKHCGRQHMLMDTRLSQLANTRVASYKAMLLGCCLGGIAASVLFFFALRVFLHELGAVFDSVIILIKRLPPQAVASSTDLLDWFGWRSVAGGRDAMTPQQSVLHLANDGILCVTRDFVIEYLNPALTHMLGFSPEHKLGSALRTMLTPGSVDTMEGVIRDLTKNPVAIPRVDFKTENGGEFSCQALCFALETDTGSDRCIIILSDIAELEGRRLDAETAQAETTKLRDAVIPEALVQRASAGEPAFSVPVASVMVVGLGRFSLEHAAPQEVMPKLTNIFLAFDKRLAEFPTLLKVRVFGESFVCVAGIFGGEIAVATDEIVTFAQNCIEILEDLNVKNYAQHTLQVGIQTGGPLLCGIIGEDGAGFDVIGEPVELAMLLQSTAPQNTIQISEGTHAQLESVGYNMTRRTLTIDKRERFTYLIRSVGSSSNAS
jgi:PAS domain S-box-containing protein